MAACDDRTFAGSQLSTKEHSLKAVAQQYQFQESDVLGMVDTGASASAGSESAVQSLLCAIVSVDPRAEIHVDSSESSRPYFRFGSGMWDRALYGVWVKSSSGRTFHTYCIPQQKPGENEQRVPILVGLSHWVPLKTILSVATGHVVYASHGSEAKPHRLQRNSRGHMMVDIVQFLMSREHETLHYTEATLSAGEPLSQFTVNPLF